MIIFGVDYFEVYENVTTFAPPNKKASAHASTGESILLDYDQGTVL